MTKLPQFLPSKSIAEAAEEAKALINAERQGKITGLFTRWEGINRAVGKYWRFRDVAMICGASGSGKSAILNMIEDDFTNPILNPTFLLKHNDANNTFLHDGQAVLEPKIMVLAFKYEMDASDEVLRNLSGKVKKSYNHLLSAEKLGSESEISKATYNQVGDEEYAEYCRQLDLLKDKPIRYIENAGNLEQLYNTCAHWKEKFSNRKMVVTIDHTLLSAKLAEKDDLELIAQTAQVAIRLRKTFNALVIPINQLNGEIEKPLRRNTPSLHFPVKTDIHCGSQIYWACDRVFIFHRPQTLDITKYGERPYPMDTKRLIHGNCIKSRKGKTGHIWFEERFAEGNIIQIERKTKEWKNQSLDFPV